jgi:ABC-2 type transport system permease protein
MLWTPFRYTLRRLRGQILGWGLGVAALGLILIPFFDIFTEQQGNLMQMIESYPPELLAFFGGDAAALQTPEGYLNMYGFSMLPLIVGIFAVMAGSGLVATDEEKGRLDLILAHPVSRTAFFWGRVLAFGAASLAIVVLGWLGFALMLGGSTLDVSWVKMALPFLPLLTQILIYGTLALLLSTLLPARSMAAAIAGVVLATSYFVSSIANISEGLATVARFLPHDYYQGGDAIGGLDAGPLLGILAVSVLFALLAWWRFVRRDIRVTGEGSLQLLARLRRRGAEG